LDKGKITEGVKLDISFLVIHKKLIDIYLRQINSYLTR